MNILVTGAKGFVGRNLCASLRNLREGKEFIIFMKSKSNLVFHFLEKNGLKALKLYFS